VLIYSDDLIVAHDKAQCSRFSCWRNLEDLYVYSFSLGYLFTGSEKYAAKVEKVGQAAAR